MFKDALYSYSWSKVSDERKNKAHREVFSFLEVESVSFYEKDSEQENT